MYTARSSPRLTYRAVESSDEAFLWSLTTNHEDWRNFNPVMDRPPTKTYISDWLKKMMTGSMLAAIVSLPKDPSNPNSAEDTPIGIVNMVGPLPGLESHHCSLFGLILLPGFQCKGYGTEAFNWAVWWQFECANMHRLELFVAEGNERAIHVYKKAGFSVEGCRREAKFFEGRYWDIFLMGLLVGSGEAGKGGRRGL
ncbi:hypothetical protein M409DRAFT_27606 [Zasmidium cellare ATCC 36951]|uniref:N-acetyltransferase domain-containing protein n=1 Tax=Zasmidium cellare ATCC 36951 TaxID=1080233 RepID=A0A6A6C6J4_ZASCE|nr:uncharacterized protein M409DRAFT_27606 [Zasmidium cellare ATCC 36951]KAF2161878.1 hypothetical protein M409DRAFT_27606 [Zasmidium cellare ATCC 36951]